MLNKKLTMSKSKFKLFCQRCVLSVCSILLFACSSSDDNNTTTSALSLKLFMDFPASLGVAATTGSGDGLTAYGQVFWASSLAEIDQLEFSVNDPSTPFATQVSPTNPYDWQQILSPSEPLDIGVNSFNMVARVGSSSFLNFFAITRGTSWMHEVAIQHDGNNGRDQWLVLDLARRALLKVDLSTGIKTVISDSVTPNATLPLIEPVDFVIDGDRALVVDRGAAAIIAIDLGTGARSIVSNVAIPNATLPFVEPTAIEIVDNSPTNKFAYITDRGAKNIIRVNLLAANEGARSVIPNLDSSVAINMPIDLAYHAGSSKLFVSDAIINGVAEIDLSAATPVIKVLEDPEGDDDDENIDYGAIRNIIVEGNTLYATDLFPYVISVNIDSGSVEYGDRTPLSGAIIPNQFYFPNQLNPFIYPSALAFESAGNRLLVVDNFQGVLVAVELADNTDIDGDGSLDGNAAGHRSYITGGATVGALGKDNAEVEGEELSYTGREAPLLGVLAEFPVDALVFGSTVITLDRLNNSIVIIDAKTGGRSGIVQHFDSPEETNFIDPRTIQFSSDGNYYIVDAATDRVIQVPANAAARTVVSDDISAVSFINPVDSVIVDTTLYVLDAGLMDVVEVNLDDGARSLMGLSCLTNPSVMLHHADLTAAPTVSELVVVEQSTTELYSVDLLVANACAPIANYGVAVNAVDIVLDTRSSDPVNYDVLILDAVGNAIVPVRVGANDRGLVAAPYIPLNNNADEFILPVAMGFDRVNQRAYVLDRAIRSVFAVDLRWRTTSEHVAVGVDNIDFKISNGSKDEFCRPDLDNPGTDKCDDVVVDAQRVIISRGTALNCDAAIATCN